MRAVFCTTLLAAGMLAGAGDIRTHTLANGMKIVVQEDHGIPNVAMYFFYKVGSRNERPGATGISHFFEHMMFNGAKKYGPKQFDVVMEKNGGENNAYTTQDVTVYTDWFPSNALELMFDMEADRIRDLAFDPKLIESERGVVYSERRLSVDNSPFGALMEQALATAYVAHPYQWPVVGWATDIESWTLEDLQNHFRMGYAPNNCTMVLAGDVSYERVLELAKKYLEPIPRHDPPPAVRTKEPEQEGERRVELHKPAQLPLLAVLYHVPESRHPDYASLRVLSALLTEGQSSRLYKRMVDTDQAVLSVESNVDNSLDPGIFQFSLQPRSGIEPARAEKTLYEEIEKLQAGQVPAEELRKAKNQLLVDLYRQQKTIARRANLLGTYEVFEGDYSRLATAGQRIESVTSADLQRVARQYLTPRNRTVATLVPEKDGEAVKRLILALAAASILPAQIKLPPYTRDVLPNGTVVYLMPKPGLPLVELRILVKGGEESEPAGMAGLASVTAELLRRGTEKRTADQFSQQVDSLGCAFETDTDQQATVVTAEFLSKDLEAALGLIADAVLHPVFPQAEVQKLIARRVDDVKSMKDEPREAIQQYYRSYYFGSTHPYGRVPDEATLDRMRRDDIVAYHRKAYAGKNLVVIAAGDFEPEAARAAIGKLFAGAPSGAGYPWTSAPAQTTGGPRVLLVDQPGATQTYFLIAQPGIDRNSPDRVPLILVNTLFGGRFTSMLNDALRVNSGLTYGASSQLQQSRLRGGLTIWTFTKTETTEKAIDLALDVVKRVRNPGLTAEQLASAKAYVKGMYPTRRLETADQLATVLGDLELFGLDRSDVDEFFSRIDAVTLEQANAIANKYYRDEKLTFVLLGDAGKIRGVVKKYAPSVVEKSTTQPGW